MRVRRFIAILPLIALAGALGALLWEFMNAPAAGRLDAYAASRIRSTCHFQSQCVVRLRDLFAGDFDTFYEFGSGVSQAEVDRTLGRLTVQKEDGHRLLVLTRDGRLVSAVNENTGIDAPLDGEVEFGDERHREDHIVEFSRDTRLQVNAFPAQSSSQAGTFYVLTPVE